jgi:hypothetical protein
MTCELGTCCCQEEEGNWYWPTQRNSGFVTKCRHSNAGQAVTSPAGVQTSSSTQHPVTLQDVLERMHSAFTWFNRFSEATYITNYTNWAPLAKPHVPQLFKNFPTFYGNWRFIIVFTRALHWSLSSARSIQLITTRLTSLRLILLLYSHLRPSLPSGLFPSALPTKFLHVYKLLSSF